MELVHQCDRSGLQVMLIRGSGSERDSAERELLDAGVPLALMHRDLWTSNLSRWESLFLLVRDPKGQAIGGAAIEEVRTRALPGHLILRLGRFGGSLPSAACRALLQAAASLAKKDKRVLRLQVNIFSRFQREEIGKMLRDLGFREIRPPTSYRHTLVIDLRPSEEEIFAAFGKSARNRVRETLKKSLRSHVITDPTYADRLKELQTEALRRTGGHTPSEDWRAILKISQEHPNLSCVFGLFVSEDTAPENMAAFSWVCSHVDHGEYRASGSTRRDDVRIPFSYLLVWDMVRWAKAAGAEWFDMGGVTLRDGDEDALEGISDFKRFFTHEVTEVGAEWVLEPSPVRAKIASVVSDAALRVRGWMKR